MRATVPGDYLSDRPFILFLAVRQEAVNRLKKMDTVEITVHGPDGKIIQPIFHR